MATYKARSTKNMRHCLVLFNQGEGVDFIVFDVESTGLKPSEDYIVELAAIKCVIKNGEAEEIDRMDIFIRPPFYMNKDVIAIHGITNEFLEDKPSEADYIEQIREFFGPYPILCGHNVEFDIAMMQAMYKRCGYEFQYENALDTLNMARDIVRKDESDTYKLSDIVTLYGVDDGLTFHHAIDDVEATCRILKIFHREYEEKLKTMNLTDREKPIINYLHFWKGYNKMQQGVYVNTNLGKIYLSTYQKCWCSTEVDLERVDVDYLESEVCRKTGLDFNTLGKMTESKWEKIKSTIKK